MPRILALDWDQREARYVLASASGVKLSIRAAASVPLVDVVEGGSEPHPDLANSLRAALAKEKVGRAVTLVGVDRQSIELLHFTLPPAQGNELAELVSNQALRESQTITEDSALDFLPLDDNPAKPRKVAAAALSAEQLEQITATCKDAGVKPHRLLLRPFASASLFSRTAADTEGVCLLLNLVADEVDLTVLDEGKVILSRTVRLPNFADEEKTSQRVLGEINRTLAVALPGQLDDNPVRRVCVFGGPGEHEDLIDRIRRELFLPAEAFHPFQAMGAPATTIPDKAGCFAPLLGMVLDEVHGSHAIDFLHPRQKPKPVDRRRIAAAVAAVVVALAVGIGYYISTAFAAVNADNLVLENRLRTLNASLKQSATGMQVFAAVRDWRAGDVIWLEELRELSLLLPDGQDVLISRMSMSPARVGAGGEISLQGAVQESSTVVRMEQGLRDGFHQVRSPSVRERASGTDYPWSFEASVFVAERNKTQYTRHLQALSRSAPPP